MKKEILYEDRLVKIVDDSIILKNYYFMFISKIISFTNIETIETKEPTFGESFLVFPPFVWRLSGFGIIEHRITYFPLDLLRSRREKIFIITFKHQRLKSGFTVEDTSKVERILKEKEWVQKIFS